MLADLRTRLEQRRAVIDAALAKLAEAEEAVAVALGEVPDETAPPSAGRGVANRRGRAGTDGWRGRGGRAS